MLDKFSRNFIIGIAFLISLALLYFGINFLKGVNVLKKQNTYVVLFDDVSGLYNSSPIYVNGFQIGLVNNLKIHSNQPILFAVDISLEGNYKIPQGSYFEFGADFLGASEVSLIVNENASAFYSPGDTLSGQRKQDMMNTVTKMMPRTESILMKVDSVVFSLNKIMSNPAWENSLLGVEATVTELSQSSKSMNQLMMSLRNDLPAISQNLNAVTSDLKNVSEELNSVDVNKTFQTIDKTLNNLQLLSEKLTRSDNSLGKLMNDTQLHDSLTHTIDAATQLLNDLREHPEKYLSVKVRLF